MNSSSKCVNHWLHVFGSGVYKVTNNLQEMNFYNSEQQLPASEYQKTTSTPQYLNIPRTTQLTSRNQTTAMPLTPNGTPANLKCDVKCWECGWESSTMVPYKWDSSIQRWTRDTDKFWVKCRCKDGCTIEELPTRFTANSKFKDAINRIFRGEGKDRGEVTYAHPTTIVSASKIHRSRVMN